MPIELTRQPGFVRLDFRGEVTNTELNECLAELEAIERSEPTAPNRLADLTRMLARTAPLESIRELAARRRTAVLANPIKTAILTATPAALGFGRMFQTLNDNPAITIRIFESEADAVRWLLED
ncbi:MAG TPA: hypothetical protein VN700_19260 [Vicinamibacterales bacterium]|nr:hypothetical protein [Vicinamibacterales bacterium]